MKINLENKVALITGSTRSIGYAVARLYAQNGAKVVVCGRTLKSASDATVKLVEEIGGYRENFFPIGVDMENKEQIRECVKEVILKFGKIDILVCNAGITANHSFLESTDEDFKRMFDINFFGAVTLTREVVRYMKDEGGCIIYTGSMVGIYGGVNQAEYVASKFAINGFAKDLARELGRYNIRVNVVAPGIVATDMMREYVSDEMEKSLIEKVPLKRLATVDDIAGTYLYLASDLGIYSSGSIISVDGGLVM